MTNSLFLLKMAERSEAKSAKWSYQIIGPLARSGEAG